MTDQLKYDELNTSIERIIAHRDAASTGDEDLDALARLASGLRGLPNPDFKVRLSAELLPKPGTPAWWPFASFGGLIARAKRLRAEPWLRHNRPFAAAGASYGLLGGTCCLSGAAANVLGIASAAAISSFIQGALPYFVALSIAGLVVWLLARVVREQGLTLANLAVTVRRHGVAMGSSYGAVFGASMGLAMAMGLY